jgi:hypothetical protein
MINEEIKIIQNLGKIYDILNRELFDKKLPKCLITIGYSDDNHGFVSYIKNGIIENNNKQVPCTIEIGMFYICMESLLSICEVMVHEMLHLKFYLKNKITEYNGHGDFFVQGAKRLGLIENYKDNHYLLETEIIKDGKLYKCYEKYIKGKLVFESGFKFNWLRKQYILLKFEDFTNNKNYNGIKNRNGIVKPVNKYIEFYGKNDEKMVLVEFATKKEKLIRLLDYFFCHIYLLEEKERYLLKNIKYYFNDFLVVGKLLYGLRFTLVLLDLLSEYISENESYKREEYGSLVEFNLFEKNFGFNLNRNKLRKLCIAEILEYKLKSEENEGINDE